MLAKYFKNILLKFTFGNQYFYAVYQYFTAPPQKKKKTILLESSLLIIY